jgi:hypothetical protein
MKEIGATMSDCKIGFIVSETQCCQFRPEGEFAPGEDACVGAGLGGGFENAKEFETVIEERHCTKEALELLEGQFHHASCVDPLARLPDAHQGAQGLDNNKQEELT